MLSKISANFSVDRVVLSAGLKTMVHPAARAGPIFLWTFDIGSIETAACHLINYMILPVMTRYGRLDMQCIAASLCKV